MSQPSKAPSWPQQNRKAVRRHRWATSRMTDNSPKDVWQGASAYERFMGRWSRDLARHFVSWLAAPPEGHWLEVGCGTGALTSAIVDLGRPASVMATDASAQYIGDARKALPDQRVQFLVASAENLPRRAEGYDVVASSLVLNFIPDPVAALREMGALGSDNGVVGVCVWDYAEGMQFLRHFWDAAVALDPAAHRYDEGERFPICSPPALEAAFREAGFPAVEVQGLEVETRFADFEDYWTPFVGGPGPAPGYLASLSAGNQEELARRLEAALPRDSDGSVPMTARAWVAQAGSGRAV